ncbi:MAG TPA: TetR/AcrR family transcriptional regulator [Acidimicrobiales bacterium]|nr:TetR/AcrR family transcriptional regulator [Acidimicrobiales bacterium]
MGDDAEADSAPGPDTDPEAGRHPPAVDGRTARRDRNRDAVLDAVIELFGEGMLLPAAVDVAERSGVSPRSVFRYFEDTEALSRAAISRHMELVEPLFALPDAAVGSVDDRIERLVATRLRLWEAVAPVARAVIVRAPVNELIAAQLERNRERMRAQVETAFAGELDACDPAERRALLAAVDVLCGYEGLDHLRRHRDMTVSQSRDVLIRALSRLFAARPGEPGVPG